MPRRDESVLADMHCDPLHEQRNHFEQLLAAHRDKIVLYLFSLVHDENDAEDVCQRSCLIMWKKFSEYDCERSFLAWACGIARFEALNYRRAAAVDRLVFQSDVMHLLATSLESVDRFDRSERLGALRRCMQSLPERDRTLLQRVYWKKSPCDAIAKELGCSRQTFYNRMYLLRRRLLQCVARRIRAGGEGRLAGDVAE